MHERDVAERAVPAADAQDEQIRRLVAERDALQAEVERLNRREQERRERVRRKRAERQSTPQVEALPPPGISQSELAIIAERTRGIVDPAELYLDLLKNCLTRLSFGERPRIDPRTGEAMPFDAQRRAVGSDTDVRPSEAETMVGMKRLDNVQQCVVDVLRNRVPGDLVETGVWRGGVTILMRAILKAYGDSDRLVWVADSFAGLPVPDDEQYPADEGRDFSPAAGFEELAVPVDQVQSNFSRYGLLDEQVRFLVGWFRATLPTAPIERISVLRLDGDLYESTMDALTSLYPKLSIGGYLIVDDYLSWRPCQQAVDDYRAKHGITEPIHGIDWTGVYWQRDRLGE